MNKKHDLAVIGAGSGGLVAATSAKRAGLTVALLEKKIGGECLHTGCVQSKTFINSARLYASIKVANEFGLPNFIEKNEFDFSKVMEHVNSVVKHIYKGENPKAFQRMGIDVYVHKSGAKAANGDILFFVHADMTLPKNILKVIHDKVNVEGFDGGGILNEFSSYYKKIKLLGRLLNFRIINKEQSERKIFYGDNGIFVKKNIFDELSCFKEIPIMEITISL